MSRRGFVLIMTFIFMLALAAIAMATVSLISSNTRFTGSQLDGTKALYLAEAGIENKLRYVRDGQPLLALLPTMSLGDGTIENTLNDHPNQDTLKLRINMLGSVGSGTALTKARVIATFTDDGNGKFLTCTLWQESYE